MASSPSPGPPPPWVTELLAMNRKVVRNLSASSYFLEGNNNPSSGESSSAAGVVSSSKMSGETKTSTLRTGTGGGPSLPKNGFVQQKAGSVGSNSKQVVNPATLGSKTKNNGIQMISSTEKQQQYGNGIGSLSLDEQMLYRTRGLNTARGSTTTTGKLLGL
jgi:hypothetical protein